VLCAGTETLASLANHPLLALISALVALLFAVPHFLLIVWLDRHEREPPGLLLTALAWGALPATALSGLGNGLASFVLSAVLGPSEAVAFLTASLSAPVVEETAKGLGLLLLMILFWRRLDSVLDGVVYGALLGLGFAAFENFTYYARSDALAGLLTLTWLRGVLSGLGTHVAFTALTGAGLGAFRASRQGSWRWALPPLALGAAMAAHFGWNTFSGLFLGLAGGGESFAELTVGVLGAVAVLQLPFLLLLGLVAALAGLHEKRVLRQYLASEDPSLAPPGEAEVLSNSWARLGRRLSRARREGWTGWRRQGQQDRWLIELAFERWHLDYESHLGAPAAGEHARRVQRLRERLRQRPR
jgi:RsiW-degrading membrane proteinase PrsW (M82 family)